MVYDYGGNKMTDKSQVDITKGNWLILSRTISRQLKIGEELQKKNLYYQTNKGKSFKVNLFNAAMMYDDWCKKKRVLQEREEKQIQEYLGDNLFNRSKNWYDQFVEADEKEKLYIKNMIENGYPVKAASINPVELRKQQAASIKHYKGSDYRASSAKRT